MLLRTLAQLDATQAALAAKEHELERVRHWLEQMLRHRYGQKRERVDENQLFLFAAEIASRGQEPPPEPKPAASRAAAGSAGTRTAAVAAVAGAAARGLRPGRRRAAVPRVPGGAAAHRRGDQRATGVRAGLAARDPAGLPEVRLPEGLHGGHGREAAGADREGPGRDRGCWRTWR